MFLRNPRKSGSDRRAMQVEEFIKSQHCKVYFRWPAVVSARDINQRRFRVGRKAIDMTWDCGSSTVLKVKLWIGTGEGEIQFLRRHNASARLDSSSFEVSAARLRPARRGMGMFRCITSVCSSSCHTLRSWVISKKSLHVCCRKSPARFHK